MTLLRRPRPEELRALAPKLANDFGIHLPAGSLFTEARWGDRFDLAMDAQPTLVTQPSAGIPAYLSTLWDPNFIDILVAPMRATEIYPEEKKGDWTMTAAEFPTIESTGQVTSYGDWNNNGNVNTNVNWTPRQSYHYQTIQQYGEQEIERWGLARINYVAGLDRAAALVMNKFLNASYLLGVTGLYNYGAMNDPSLPAAILPNVKAVGGYAWIGTGTGATAKEIYNDFLRLFSQLQTQMGGLLKMSDRIKIVMSPGRAVVLRSVSDFNVTALTTINQNFPNLEIVEVPEYSTASGELMQMIAVDPVDGQQTGLSAFTEKMRAHPVIASLSGWQQKKSGGTWGTIIRRPIAVAQMLGI